MQSMKLNITALSPSFCTFASFDISNFFGVCSQIRSIHVLQLGVRYSSLTYSLYIGDRRSWNERQRAFTQFGMLYFDLSVCSPNSLTSHIFKELLTYIFIFILSWVPMTRHVYTYPLFCLYVTKFRCFFSVFMSWSMTFASLHRTMVVSHSKPMSSTFVTFCILSPS
jgi:hypothetical protein